MQVKVTVEWDEGRREWVFDTLTDVYEALVNSGFSERTENLKITIENIS